MQRDISEDEGIEHNSAAGALTGGLRSEDSAGEGTGGTIVRI
jgi:hypothetical protein